MQNSTTKEVAVAWYARSGFAEDLSAPDSSFAGAVRIDAGAAAPGNSGRVMAFQFNPGGTDRARISGVSLIVLESWATRNSIVVTPGRTRTQTTPLGGVDLDRQDQ